MLKFFRKSKEPSKSAHWNRRWSPAGVVLSHIEGQDAVWVESPLLNGFLTQLADDGLVLDTADGYLFGWDSFYTATSRPEYAALSELLMRPPRTAARQLLRSNHSLTDRDFLSLIHI